MQISRHLIPLLSLRLSLLCGFAGANFASSMAKYQLLFPKAHQGGALGLNGGLGNLGVSVMQLIAPLVVSVGVFAMFSGPVSFNLIAHVYG